METSERLKVRDGEEIWETCVPGRVWVTTVNARGVTKPVTVGGYEGARLRIATLDREISQENIVDPANDPFINGTLRRIDTGGEASDDQAMSTEELMVVFAKDGKAFQTYIDGLSEINVRRLMAIAEDVDASVSQVKYLKASIAKRWPVTSGDTPTYRDLAKANQVAGQRGA